MGSYHAGYRAGRAAAEREQRKADYMNARIQAEKEFRASCGRYWNQTERLQFDRDWRTVHLELPSNPLSDTYEQALKEKKEHFAAEGLPWNSAEAELFDHELRVAHIPLPDLSLNKPSERLLLILCILIPSLMLYWAYCDAFIEGNARSLILIAAFLISFFFQGRLFIRLVFAARKAKKIGAEAWLHEESNRQKAKGISPWNASEHAPWM